MPPESKKKNGQDFEMEKEFQQTGAGLFAKIESLCEQIEKSGYNLRPEQLTEFFRLTHTFKGNAAMLGFEKSEHFAHVIEDFLIQFRVDGSADQLTRSLEPNECRFLCWAMQELIRSTKDQDPGTGLKGTQQATTDSFFLMIEFDAKQFLVPGSAVAEVVYKPETLLLPVSSESKNSALVRTKTGWAPLMSLGVLLGQEQNSVPQFELKLDLNKISWVVVLSNGYAFCVDDVIEMLEFPFLSVRSAFRKKKEKEMPISVLPLGGSVKSG